MSADVLRRAATVLREHAGATRPGAWIGSQDVRREADAAGRHHGSRLSPGDAHWIALMQPSVGPALADWLEVVAAWQDEGLGRTYGIEHTNYPDAISSQLDAALATARALLREEAPDER